MGAIRPPDEVIENPDKPTKSSVSSEQKQKTSKKFYLDIWMGLVIFIAAGIEAISWIIPQNKDYLLFWYPLLNTFTLTVFSSFFVMKAFRYKSCVYSKIASIGYSLINIISMIAILLPDAKVVTILMFAYPVIVFCIILSLLILFARYVINNTTPS